MASYSSLTRALRNCAHRGIVNQKIGLLETAATIPDAGTARTSFVHRDLCDTRLPLRRMVSISPAYLSSCIEFELLPSHYKRHS